ncbi:unnamed protein product [Rotaria socialis]|uniref:Aquaporin n=2 Tax=Rotaria socialis TaxID=392032 RepID=A0A817UEP7_9BILA|nr:unnamed protein product [Rotaria socialis]CAF3581132.1 unnamed protein product [Rotaria socialis]CAF4308340.1 unnamed protein product [Rotaria socialis]CAF4397048.1 unnamed protein product [Rotaria socialis]CAF4499914.1 unnamed protein product [Rotaria socialis]
MSRATKLKQYAAQCLAELFGTFVLMLIGNLAVAQFKFTKPDSALGVNISYGAGVYMALMIAGPISGAHLNPAVTLGLLSLRKMEVVQSLFYIVGQIMGAFLASAVVFIVYYSQINIYDGGIRQIEGPNATVDIFYTVPAPGIPNWNCLVDAMVGTTLLLIFIMAVGNDYNNLISNAAKPFSFALLVTALGLAMSFNCGNPINPARDFGPRLFTACVYGGHVFRVNNYYFWTAIVGPIIGAITGVWIYEGYLILMKRYANLSGIIHIDAVEQLDQRENEKSYQIDKQVSSESS